MSSFPMNAEHSPPQSPCPPNFPDLSTLAEKLQETAQALLTFCQSSTHKEDGMGSNADGTESEEDSAFTEKTPYQVRSYQLSKSVLAQEQEILKAHDAENWQEVLHLLRARFETVTLLLKHFDVGEEIDGFSLNQIAENLMEPILDMLNKLCSLVVDFDLVYELKTE